MKVGRIIALLAVLVLVGGALRYFWRQAEPRRNSFHTLQQFNHALASGDTPQLLALVSQPAALQGRTSAEQSEFLVKALRDEISVEGLAVLQRDGAFGSLTNIFPAEAKTWSNQAGVKPEDCVAFKLERNGIRAEVVLVQNPDRGTQNAELRIVRCNNVKQLAADKL
ncbi:MAG: hypothetical protein EXS35_03465 [Pedosphaera sp.]|nr:hypothetical protein [Pedosphaera sp.]